MGREVVSPAAATLRGICKQDVEGPTKADETMPLPLPAQKMGKVFGRYASKKVRTELAEGLGGTCGFEESTNGGLAHTSLIPHALL